MVVESGEWGRGRNPIDELAMAAKSGEQRKRTRSVRRERRIEPLKRERWEGRADTASCSYWAKITSFIFMPDYRTMHAGPRVHVVGMWRHVAICGREKYGVGVSACLAGP
jgi:hypothetical protein